MEENTFWLGVWKTVGIVVCVLASIAAGCTTHQGILLDGMVKAGADPLRASCALNGTQQGAVCVAAAIAAK